MSEENPEEVFKLTMKIQTSTGGWKYLYLKDKSSELKG
jgi:hypothetical protein